MSVSEMNRLNTRKLSRPAKPPRPMGSGKDRTVAKVSTSLTQDTPNAPSQSGWQAYMQPFYGTGTPSPPFIIASICSPHPNVSGNQQPLMQSYGNPLPHPRVCPVHGPILAIHGEEGKMFTSGGTGSITIGEKNSESIGFLDGNSEPMGTEKDRTLDKETSTTPSQFGWQTNTQPFYGTGTPSPPFIIASICSPHPNVSGNQQPLMQSYGNSLPHPRVCPVHGPILAIHGEEGKMFTSGGTGSITIGEKNSESIGFLDGKSEPMGTEKDRTLDKETSTTPSQFGWQTYTQSFYGAGTPSSPLCIPVNASIATPHPYVSGNQHPLMQSYGSPLQQPAVYHHGELYPHSNVVVGDTGSITIDERSSENIGFLDGKSGEKDNVASFSGNDGASKSASNGRKDSFDESDDTVTHECFPTKKRSYGEFTTDDAQNRSTSQYSDANPVSVLEDPVALKDRPIESGSVVSFPVASAMQVEPQSAKPDKWIQDPILTIPQEDGKILLSRDLGSIRICEGSPEDKGLLDGKSGETENAASVSGRYGASESAANGRKNSFDASDDKIAYVAYDFFPNKMRSYDKLTADDMRSKNTAQYHDANPVSVEEDPMVLNSKIDLNLRMILNAACTESLPLKVRPIASNILPPVGSAMRVEPPQQAKPGKRFQNEHKMKMERRMLAIWKETVRRAKLRKRKGYETLQAAVEELKLSNSLLSKGLIRLSEECMKQNCQIKSPRAHHIKPSTEVLTETIGPYSDVNTVSALEDPVVSNPKIDLTLRMSLDAACSEPAALKVRPIESGSGVSSPVASAMQEEYENLQAAVEGLKFTNFLLSEGLIRLSKECMKQNCQIMSLMEELPAALEPDPNYDLVVKDLNSIQPVGLQPVSDKSNDEK